MVHLLPHNVSAIVKAAAKASVRYALAAVKMDASADGQYRVEATDGKVLARVEGNTEPASTLTDYPALVSAPNSASSALVPAAGLGAAGKSTKHPIGISLGEKQTTIGTVRKAGIDVSTLENCDGRYPQTDDVFPSAQKGASVVFSITFDPELLASLLEIASTYTDRVRFDFFGKDKPAELHGQSESQKFSGIIMPLS